MWNTQGDRERDIEGMEISPMMDRHNASIEKSQVWTTVWILRIKRFHVQTKSEEFKNATINGHFSWVCKCYVNVNVYLIGHSPLGIFRTNTSKQWSMNFQMKGVCLWRKLILVREIIWLLWLIRFQKKLRFQNVFRSYGNEELFKILLVWRTFTKKLRFRDGLVWTVGVI